MDKKSNDTVTLDRFLTFTKQGKSQQRTKSGKYSNIKPPKSK